MPAFLCPGLQAWSGRRGRQSSAGRAGTAVHAWHAGSGHGPRLLGDERSSLIAAPSSAALTARLLRTLRSYKKTAQEIILRCLHETALAAIRRRRNRPCHLSRCSTHRPREHCLRAAVRAAPVRRATQAVDGALDVGLDRGRQQVVAALALAVSTAGTIGSIIAPIAPGKNAFFSTTDTAAATAPQLSWPITTTSGTPSWLTAYSIEPNAVVSTVLPALRTMNISPRPRPNSSSGGTRESEHDTRITNGVCPRASSRRRLLSEMTFLGRFSTKAALPSRSTCNACSALRSVFSTAPHRRRTAVTRRRPRSAHNRHIAAVFDGMRNATWTSPCSLVVWRSYTAPGAAPRRGTTARPELMSTRFRGPRPSVQVQSVRPSRR